MSRVRDALKRANTMPVPPALSHSGPATPAGQTQTAVAEPEPASPQEFEEPDIESPEIQGLELEAFIPPKVKARHPLLRPRWVRRLLRFAGIRTGGPVPVCRGVTRMGLACRGLAMANGFCRQHGGSRSGSVAETTRTVLERISTAR